MQSRHLLAALAVLQVRFHPVRQVLCAICAPNFLCATSPSQNPCFNLWPTRAFLCEIPCLTMTTRIAVDLCGHELVLAHPLHHVTSVDPGPRHSRRGNLLQVEEGPRDLHLPLWRPHREHSIRPESSPRVGSLRLLTHCGDVSRVLRIKREQKTEERERELEREIERERDREGEGEGEHRTSKVDRHR